MKGPGPEKIDHVFELGATPGEARASKRVIGVDANIGDLELRQCDDLRVSVSSEVHLA